MYKRGEAEWATRPERMTAREIIDWRLARDLSQQQVADMLAIDRKSLSRWECDLHPAPPWLGVAFVGIDTMRARRETSDAGTQDGS